MSHVTKEPPRQCQEETKRLGDPNIKPIVMDVSKNLPKNSGNKNKTRLHHERGNVAFFLQRTKINECFSENVATTRNQTGTIAQFKRIHIRLPQRRSLTEVLPIMCCNQEKNMFFNATASLSKYTERTQQSLVKKKLVRLVSVKAERPNHPSRSHARQGGGVLHDDTDMTP